MTNHTPPGTPDCLAAALDYEKRGYSVIPVALKSKIPLVEWKEYQKRRPTVDEIRAWWTQWPDANVGIVTGPISDCCVLDVDGKEGYASIKGRHLPETRVSITGRDERGFHHWFKLLPGVAVPSINGLLPGVDLKGEGGYVVAPPSVHPTGRKYKWVDGFGLDMPLAERPAWILDEVKARKAQSASRSPEDYAALLRGVVEGRRHDATAALCGRYAALGVSQAEVVQIALNHNAQCDPPRDEDEVIRDATDIWEREQKKRPSSPPPTSSPDALPPLVALTYDELMTEADRTVDWDVERFISHGSLVFISGPPKASKSFLAIHIGLALSTGKPVHDHFVVPSQRRVLMIQEEDPRGRMARRLKQLVVGERPANDMFKFVIRSGLQLDQAPWLAALKQLLDEFKPDVVILDPFSALHSGKENDGQEMSQIVKTIRASLVFRGITVIVVHHTRKDQKGASERADQATRGHSVLSAAADTLLTVKGLGQNTNQVRVSMLSKEEIETEAYIYRFEQSEPGGSIHLPYDGDAAEAKGRENMVKVVASVEALWQTGGADACSRKAIAERVGVSDNTVELGADIAWKAGRLQKGWVKPPSARNRMRAYIPPNVTANGSWEPWEESDSPSLDGFQAANGNGGSLALSDEQGHASYPPNPLPPQVLGAAVNTGEIGGEA